MFDFTRARLRARLRKNGYSFVGAWAKVNPWTATDAKIAALLPVAAKQAGAVLPVAAFDGHRIKEFIAVMEAFFATPLGQAVEQILLKLLLGITLA